MKRNFKNDNDLARQLEQEFPDAKYLGEGHNGIVFSLPDNKVVKFFKTYKVWSDESYILGRVGNRSRFFPKMFKAEKDYIIREYVGGKRLDKYLNSKEITDKICEELYLMIKDFERLDFKRLDIRCKDLFVQDDESIMVIDPKNNYKKTVSYPRHLMKGLHKRGMLEYFFNYMEKRDYAYYIYWEYKFNKYLKNNKFK